MEKSEESISKPALPDAAPTDKNSTEKPVQPGQPVDGTPAANVITVPPGKSEDAAAEPLILGHESCTVVCPSCHQTVQTEVKHEKIVETDFLSELSALFGCCLFCLLRCFCCRDDSGDGSCENGFAQWCVYNCKVNCIDNCVRCCQESCLFGCCVCCTVAQNRCPGCCDNLTARHYCPSCKALIGSVEADDF